MSIKYLDMERRKKTMRKINDFLTNISEKILKKLCLRNTKSNQNFISAVLGYTVMFIVLLIYKFVL